MGLTKRVMTVRGCLDMARLTAHDQTGYLRGTFKITDPSLNGPGVVLPSSNSKRQLWCASKCPPYGRDNCDFLFGHSSILPPLSKIR